MFRKNLIVMATVLATVFGASTAANAARQMDNGIWVDVYRMGNSRTGRMAILFLARNDNGNLAICGNYYMWGGGSVHRRLERTLKGYRFFYNGRTLFTDASFLWRAPNEDAIGSQETCRTTDIPYVENANDLLGGRLPFSR
ncbi:MAG: hypothetical protein L3J33_10300 [Rhodobacteraceae bacterium]|nr:hypothetical protein [Paracoccaceae bacterium]